MGNVLDRLKNVDDTYSMALMMLYASTDNPDYSLLSELVYLMDHDSFMNIVKYFEGQTIKIPTSTEIQDSLRMLMLFSYVHVDKLPWNEALDKSGIPADESKMAKRRLAKFVAKIRDNNYKLKGVLDES